MDTRRPSTWTLRLVPVFAALGITLLVAIGSGVQAQTPSAANIASGMRIYRQKADCHACHGWAGDGRKMDNQMPDGANLRTTHLDRDQLIFVIKCGLPGRSMPAFDQFAYSDDRCLGRTQADLQRMGWELPDPTATLQPREIERLADFLFAKVVGQGPMDRAKCIDYWGSDVEVCSEFPNERPPERDSSLV